MNWEAVIENLREQANDAVSKAEAIRSKQPLATGPSAGPGGGYNDQLIRDRDKTIERHRIHGNFCYGLANALEAGLKP